MEHINFLYFVSDNNFRCDCGLEWIQSLYYDTTRQSLKESLAEVECSFGEDKIVHSPVISEKFACPEAEDAAQEEWIMPDTSKVMRNLLSISKKELSCPEEYRPTPITVKQVTTNRPLTGSAKRIFTEISSYVCFFTISLALL